jgi:hypothetical protein
MKYGMNSVHEMFHVDLAPEPAHTGPPIPSTFPQVTAFSAR